MPREIVHLDPPRANRRDQGEGFAACDPAVKIGKAGARFTGHPKAVTCAACMATTAYAELAAEHDFPMPADLDVEVAVDAKKMTITPCAGCR